MSLNLKDTISNNINTNLKNTDPSSANLNQQALIDKALVNAGLPENKLNSIIALIKDRFMCDSACQQKRTADMYKEKWELAKKQYKEAPEEIALAEKNYYVFDKGYPAYKDMLYSRYTKTAEEFKQKSIEKHTQLNEEIEDLIASYETGIINLRGMNDLFEIKIARNKQLKRDIDDYMANTQTNGRKVVYEDRARDWLNTLWSIILFFYVVVLVLYIIYGGFIPNKEYLSWQGWLTIIAYILLPFLMSYLVNFLFAVVNYIKSWSFLFKTPHI